MVGVDEVGRGCWAGPLLVVAARPIKPLPKDLTDSKLLSRSRREELFVELIKACEFGEGWVSAQEIDQLGLANALRRGIKSALSAVRVLANEEIILDGSANYLDTKFINGKCVVDADLNIPIVSAASIYAKVTRDKYMAELSLKHPNYGFERHVGYGTVAHKSAILEQGIINGVHRLSFKPVGVLSSL
jgi:ribonuclease HII